MNVQIAGARGRDWTFTVQGTVNVHRWPAVADGWTFTVADDDIGAPLRTVSTR